MIIKKLAKICREHKSLTVCVTNDGMWAGTHNALYAMNGIPTMNADSLMKVFDWTEKVKRSVNVLEGVELDRLYDDSGDTVLEEPPRYVMMGTENYRIFRERDMLYFVPEEYFDIIKDFAGGEEFFLLRKIPGQPDSIVVRQGLIPVAVLIPAQLNDDFLQGWCAGYNDLIADIGMYVAARKDIYSADTEDEQMKMLEDINDET